MKRQTFAAVILLAFFLVPPLQASADSSSDAAFLKPKSAFSISFFDPTSAGSEENYRFLVFEPKSIRGVQPILVQETPEQTQPGQAPQQEPVTQPEQPTQPQQPAEPMQPTEPTQPEPGQPAQPVQPYPGEVDEGVQPREGYPAEVQPEAGRRYGWGYAWWWWIIIAAIILFFIVIFAAWGGWGAGRGPRPPEDRL